MLFCQRRKNLLKLGKLWDRHFNTTIKKAMCLKQAHRFFLFENDYDVVSNR